MLTGSQRPCIADGIHPAGDASWRKIEREFGEIRTAVWMPN